MIIDSPVISGSFAASFRNVAITGSLGVTGSITTTGTITAQTLVVQTITSSVNFVTGSTKFGAIVGNTHQFTGSVNITGSLSVVTTGTELQVNATGVNLGNVLTDSHVISGSLRVNPGGLFVSGSGLVGIGTTSPLALLDVCVLSSGARRLLVNYADSIVTVKSANDTATAENLRVWGDNIFFYTGSAGSGGELMRLTNTGRVGIGTSSPNGNLEVFGSTPTIISAASVAGSLHGLEFRQNNTVDAYIKQLPSTGEFRFYVGRNSSWGGNMSFWTDTVQRMVITSGGNILIDNGQLNTPKYLSFEGNTNAGGSLGDIRWYNYQWDSAIRAQIKGETDTGLSNGKLTFWTGGGGVSLRMTINAAGSIGAPSGTNIYNASDIRLKRNISTITDGLAKINALNPVKFNWIEGFEPTEENKDMLGFIAQEVQEVVPEAVENFNNNTITVGDTVIENSLRVNEKFIIPVLVKAIQELKVQNDSLQLQIDELKNK
jgi:hypothetical protein